MIVNEAARRAFRPDLENPDDADVRSALMHLNLMPVPFIESNDVSDLVVFLASDESRYITGATIPIDAGAAIK
jgi:(+)-trans-carveol dehydrogenase